MSVISGYNSKQVYLPNTYWVKKRGFYAVLNESLVSGKEKKKKSWLKKYTLHSSDLEFKWIKFEIRLINYGFPFWKYGLWDSGVIWTSLMNVCRRGLEFIPVKKVKEKAWNLYPTDRVHNCYNLYPYKKGLLPFAPMWPDT